MKPCSLVASWSLKGMSRDGSQNADRLHEEAKSGCYLRASRAVQHRHVYKQDDHQSWNLGSWWSR